ncbi:hypothetical protein [Desulfosporosinus sp. FKB]|uniref:hypothetical protein n=1 Tax=Desulfosporosinus sp. FKB TaxID=1969835 RepID=UPI000B4A4C79|nr:hypothetical protein [Desulfosporosinus sp. FKB]
MTIVQSERLWIEAHESNTWKEIEYDREVRLSHYNSGKRSVTESLEKVLMGGDDWQLYEILRLPLKKKAKSYENRWENYRISQHDFESAFWEETWKVIENRKWTGANGKFLLYETLCISWDRAAIDVIRFATRKKRENNARALPLHDSFEEYHPDTRIDVEAEVINRLTIEEILSVQGLTSEEKQLLEIIRWDPEGSLRELGTRINCSKDKISRTLARIRKKINTDLL